MLSKNNTQELDRKYLIADGSQRFGLRKLSVGVASVLLGTTVGLGVAGQAHADTVAETGSANVNTTATTTTATPTYTTPAQATAGNVATAVQTPAATQNVAPTTGVSTSTVNANAESQQTPQEQVASPNANSIQVQAPANNNVAYNGNENDRITNHYAGTNANANGNYVNQQINNYNVNSSVGAVNASQINTQSLVQSNNRANSNLASRVQENNQVSQLNVPTDDLKLDNRKLNDHQEQTLNVANATREFNKYISLAAEDVDSKSDASSDYPWQATGADDSTAHDHDAEKSPTTNVNSTVTVKFVDDQGNELKSPVQIRTDYVRPHHNASGQYNDWQVIGLPHLIQGSGLDLSQDTIQMHLDASQTRIPFGQHQGDPCQTFTYTIDSPVIDGYYIYSTGGEAGQGASDIQYSNSTDPSAQLAVDYSDFLGTQYGKQPKLTATVVFTYKKAAPKTSTGLEEYIDKDNGNKVVKSGNLKGNIGSQVNIDFSNPNNLPAGYEFVPGENIPSTITIDGDPIKNNVQILIQHKHVKVPHDAPKKDGTPTPDNPNVSFKNVDETNLNHQATRAINDHVEEEGSSATQPKVTKQVGNVHRDADVDEVTGEVTYTNWTTDNSSWQAYSPDVVSGHTATPDQVPAGTVTKDTQDTTVDIHYIANAVKGNLNYIDNDSKQTLKTDPLAGKAGEDVPISINDMPAGYELVPGQNIPKTVKAGADKIPDVNVYVQCKSATGQEQYIDQDDGGKVVKTGNLKGKIGSSVDIDFANPDNLPAGYEFVPVENIPSTITIDGDSAKNNVQIPIQHKHVKVPHDQPQKDGTPTPDNPNVSFKDVDANNLNHQATRTINDHVEEEGSKVTQPKVTKQVGNVHRDADVDEVTGKVTYTDWTTDNDNWKAYTPTAEKGYTANPGEVAAGTVTEDTQDTTVDIHYIANAVKGNINYIEKKTGKTLKSDPLVGKANEDVPVNANDIPEGYMLVPGQNIPKTVKAGDDKIPDVNVLVEKDHVQGNVFYKDKNSGQIVKTDQLNGKPGEDVPVNKSIPDGYDEVPGQNIPTSVKAGDDNIPDVTILVQRKAFKAPIKYVDPQGNLVKEDDNSLHGKFGDTLPVPVQIPEHWELVPGQNIPTTVPVTKDGIQTVTIVIRHKHVTYTSKTPIDQLDYGVSHSDLEKDIVRTIRVHNPQTGMVDNNLQEVTFTREVTVDEVTQAKDWTNWNQNDGGWDQFKAPDFAGFVATPESIAAKTVNIDTPDETVDIYYSPKQKKAPKSEQQQPSAAPAQQAPSQMVAGAPEAAMAEVLAAPAAETTAPAPNMAPSVITEAPTQQAALPQTGNSKDGEMMAMAGLAMMAASLGLMILGQRREM